MDSDEGKLFVGGIAWDTTEDTLRDHFGRYGDVAQVLVMRDKTTGRPRGFAFVVFSDPSLLDRVLRVAHHIDGRTVEAKRALSREEHHTSSRPENHNAGGGGNFRTRKIFVGGLPSTLTEAGFRQYFENYGHVADVVIMYDQNTQRPRGFGFITFDSEDAVDGVLHKTFHELNGKHVEVKRALPKDANPSGLGSGGVYQRYGGSSASVDDGRMDGNKYMQPQTSAGGYPTYSGYGGYGYGAANGGVGYGGFGGCGVAGYGSTGFGGTTGPYGMPGALKNTWGGQGPFGYGFGTNAGYRAVSAPSGASGYVNQGYGYGNYGGSDGPYSGGYGVADGHAGNASNNSSGSGAGGLEQQGSGVGYAAGGYSDSNGNSGYANESWRSDPSQDSGSYGGGFNGSHSRHTSQH